MSPCGQIAAALRRLVRRDEGPTATEYAILLALLVLVAVAAIRGIGERMLHIYENINVAIPT